MPTPKQQLGQYGELVVVKKCSCPKCKRPSTLRRLPPNFKCADIICDFCGYLAQVKAATVRDIDKIPDQVLGAAWKPQESRIRAGIFFPLFLVLIFGTHTRIYYLSADLQEPAMFQERKPLSPAARRAGWQGFVYNMKLLRPGSLVRLQ